MKVEKLTVELYLANDSIGKLTKEHSSVNDIIASLKNEKSIAQESLKSLEQKYRNLELNYSTLWASVTLQLKDNIECIHLMCALGIVTHISRQINRSIIIVYIHHDITSHSS
jgi:predicted nuclease with TOPRIM domain